MDVNYKKKAQNQLLEQEPLIQTLDNQQEISNRSQKSKELISTLYKFKQSYHMLHSAVQQDGGANQLFEKNSTTSNSEFVVFSGADSKNNFGQSQPHKRIKSHVSGGPPIDSSYDQEEHYDEIVDFNNYQVRNNQDQSQLQNTAQANESQRGTLVHIVDDFLTELTVDTGSEEDTSVDSEEMDENIQMIYKEQRNMSQEQNVLNQTDIIVNNEWMDDKEKVQILAQKIKELVADISSQKKIIAKLSQLNLSDDVEGMSQQPMHRQTITEMTNDAYNSIPNEHIDTNTNAYNSIPNEHVDTNVLNTVPDGEMEAYETIPNELNQHEIPNEMEEIIHDSIADHGGQQQYEEGHLGQESEEADYPIVIEEYPDYENEIENMPMQQTMDYLDHPNNYGQHAQIMSQTISPNLSVSQQNLINFHFRKSTIQASNIFNDGTIMQNHQSPQKSFIGHTGFSPLAVTPPNNLSFIANQGGGLDHSMYPIEQKQLRKQIQFAYLSQQHLPDMSLQFMNGGNQINAQHHSEIMLPIDQIDESNENIQTHEIQNQMLEEDSIEDDVVTVNEEFDVPAIQQHQQYQQVNLKQPQILNQQDDINAFEQHPQYQYVTELSKPEGAAAAPLYQHAVLDNTQKVPAAIQVQTTNTMNYNSVNLRTPSNLQGGAGTAGQRHITSQGYSPNGFQAPSQSNNEHFVFPNNCKDDQFVKIKEVIGNQLEFDYESSRHMHMRRRSKSQPSTKRLNTGGVNDTSSSMKKRRKQKHMLKNTQLKIQ